MVGSLQSDMLLDLRHYICATLRQCNDDAKVKKIITNPWPLNAEYTTILQLCDSFLNT